MFSAEALKYSGQNVITINKVTFNNKHFIVFVMMVDQSLWGIINFNNGRIKGKSNSKTWQYNISDLDLLIDDIKAELYTKHNVTFVNLI